MQQRANEQRLKIKKNLTKELADKQLRNTIILSKIERAENIQAKPEDIDREIEKIAGQFNIELDKIKNYYLNNQQLLEEMVNKITTDKVLDFLYENAKVNFITESEETTEEEK